MSGNLPCHSTRVRQLRTTILLACNACCVLSSLALGCSMLSDVDRGRIPGAGGGPATGGNTPAGGTNATGGATACGVTTGFAWTSSGPLLGPDPGHISLKDPSIVHYGGLFHVFASTVDPNENYSITYLNFADWTQAGSATHYPLSTLGSGYRAAPQVFYFTPQRKWYLIYDSGPSYSTTTDLTDPSSWTAPKPLASNGPPNWLDHWVICDATNCYLFFSADDGKWYRMQTTLGDFPGGWSSYVVLLEDPTPGRLFEASNVYRVKGSNQYLALIEAFDSTSMGQRFFRSFTADSLDGTWTPLADTYGHPFASAANVTFSGTPWTNDISHGEMLRDGYDETLTIDLCDLQYLYQGKAPSASQTYNLLPWQLGLLTQAAAAGGAGGSGTGGTAGVAGSSTGGAGGQLPLPGPWRFDSASALAAWSGTASRTNPTGDAAIATAVAPTFYQSAAGTPCENGCAAYSVDFTGTTWTQYGASQVESLNISTALTAPVDTNGATLTVKAIIPAASLPYVEGAQAYGTLSVSPWTWSSAYVGASSLTADTLLTFTTTLPATGFSVNQTIGLQIRDRASTAGTGSVTVYVESATLSR